MLGAIFFFLKARNMEPLGDLKGTVGPWGPGIWATKSEDGRIQDIRKDCAVVGGVMRLNKLDLLIGYILCISFATY